ncbi:HDIG domain-containing protein [bacterium]|nr:HDIG domain-containing protein [bacterium]
MSRFNVRNTQRHPLQTIFKHSPIIFAKFILGKKHFAVKVLLLFTLIIGCVLLFPGSEFTRYTEYKVGTISPDEVRAPLTFPVYKSKEQLEDERKEAENLIAPLFDKNSNVAQVQEANLDELMGYIRQLRLSPKPFEYTDVEGKKQNYIPQSYDSLKNAINKSFGFNILEDRWQFLINRDPSGSETYEKVKKDSARSLRKITLGKTMTHAQFMEFATDLSTILLDQFVLGVMDVEKNNFKSPISPINVRTGKQESTEFVKNINDMEEARYRIQDLLKNYYADPKLINAGYEILTHFLVPNVISNGEETKRRKKEASTSVPQTYGFVLAGDVIVRKNETITPKIHQQLISLESTWAEKINMEGGVGIILPYIGRGLLVFSLLFFLLSYIYLNRPDILNSVRKLALLVSIILIEIGFYYIFIHILNFPVYVIPIVLSSVLLTVLFDVRLGLIATVSIGFLIGAMQGYEYTTAIVLVFVGTIACVTVVNFSRRSHIFTSLLWVSLAYAFILVTMSFVKYSEFSEALTHQLPYAVASGIFSMLVAFGCLVLFESLFDVCTTFTLLELSDSNHPLQQQLAIKAPGTYHHSIIVGNLAKTAAEAIDANSLLARVGSLYHDIGKMDMPEYFAENQMAGHNKHETIAPKMSALILASHIKVGLELAEKSKLPKLIRSYIPEHHGNQLMSYFYHKAMETKLPEEEIAESDFRYPGPKPKTKESGIIMLADGVEAATHSIKEPTAAKIRAMVRSIIESRLQDGELNECELSIGDLKKIEEAFIPILLGIYHVRVEYPGQSQIMPIPESEPQLTE